MTNYFKNINISDSSFENQLKIKSKAIKQKRVLEEFFRQDGYKMNSIGQFTAITNAAYGYIKNPYYNIERAFKNMLEISNNIVEDFNDELMADNMELYISFLKEGKQFNYNIIRNMDIKWAEKTIKEFQESIKLFEEANKKSKQIFKKYLGIGALDKKVNNRYFVNNSSAFKNIYSSLDVTETGFDVKEYTLEDWNVWASSKTITVGDGYNGDYKDIAKIEFSAYFV